MTPTAWSAAWPAVTVAFMTKHFPSDFYITCATVIPVLFLAVAVQGRAYEAVLRASLSAAQARLGEQWTRQLTPLLKSRLLKFTAYAIVVAGGFGELVALLVLYRGYEHPGERTTVLAATLVLVAAVASGPIWASVQLRHELYVLGYLPRKVAPGEEEGTEDQNEGTGTGRR